MTSDMLLLRLEQLKKEHQEIEASMPAHSLPASMLIRLEELEDDIEALQKQLDSKAGN